MHVYYPAPTDHEQPCWQAGSAAIDFRGDGGYVVVPPSHRTIDEEIRLYRPERHGRMPGRPVDAAGLRQFLDPRPIPRVSSEPAHDRGVDVERIVAWVARRHEGERNAGLFWAACTFAEHGIEPTDAVDALSTAAEHAGLSERETVTTIRSAYRRVGSTRHPTTGSGNDFNAGPPSILQTPILARKLP